MCSTEFTTQEKIYALLRMLEKHYTFVEVRQLLQQLIHKIEDDKINIKDIKQTTKSSVDGGDNILTFTLSNGAKYEYVVKNGTKGQKGDTGAAGKDGTLKFEELTPELKKMLKGDKGDKGDQGDPGINGAPGINGNDGYTPVKGVDYFDGAKGDPGINASITNCSYDRDGNTIITWNDGNTTAILRGLQGPQGEPGQPGEPGKDGTMTFEDLTEEQKASLKGDTGATGPVGPQGPEGPRGPEGLKGDPGDTYVLTDLDKSDIAALVSAPEGESNVVLVNGLPISTSNGNWTCSVDKSDTDIIQMLLDGKIAYWVVKTNGTILFECPISLYFNGQGGRYLYGSYCTYVQSSSGSDVYEFKQTGTTLTITHGVLITSEALNNKGYLKASDLSTDMVVTFEDGSTATYKLKS